VLEIGITLADLWIAVPTIILWELGRPIIKSFWNRWKAAVEEE